MNSPLIFLSEKLSFIFIKDRQQMLPGTVNFCLSHNFATWGRCCYSQGYPKHSPTFLRELFNWEWPQLPNTNSTRKDPPV